MANEVKQTRVYEINGKMTVADTIDEAIKLYRQKYPTEDIVNVCSKATRHNGGEDVFALIADTNS